MATEATPEAGFADGDGDFARFDGPSGLAAAEDGTLFVADTNNHLVSFLFWLDERPLVRMCNDRSRGPPCASLADKQAPPCFKCRNDLVVHPNETKESHPRRRAPRLDMYKV